MSFDMSRAEQKNKLHMLSFLVKNHYLNIRIGFRK